MFPEEEIEAVPARRIKQEPEPEEKFDDEYLDFFETLLPTLNQTPKFVMSSGSSWKT